LTGNILPFWRERCVDHRRGGFIGWMSNELRVDADAAKGLILNARLLWTFAAAYSYTQLSQDAELAQRAFGYLTRFFLDELHGGYFWELDACGEVIADRKKCYGQAFVVYALAEYYRVFRDPTALQHAIELYRLIESRASDPLHGGYFEVFTRDWQLCDDMRLGADDPNEKKSMNNHLHVLEAWTNLARVWPDPGLAERLRDLVLIFRTRIVNDAGTHLHHFFDDKWVVKSSSYTFGHDIEGSWLLCEAAETLGDKTLESEVHAMAVGMAQAALVEGLDEDGGLQYEGSGGRVLNSDKEWWPQAEAVVGFYNAWQLTREDRFLTAAQRCWEFIQKRIVDQQHGEWFWRVTREGKPDRAQPKVSLWKCPYHNSRCCLELIHRDQVETRRIFS